MLIALANALLVLRFLPETRQVRTTTMAASLGNDQASIPPSTAPVPTVPFTNHGMGGVLAGWRWVLRNPAVARLVVINLLFTVAFTAMEAVFPLFTQHSFGWKAIQNGYIFTYAGILIVLMQGGLVGRLVKRWGERSLLIAGLVMLAAGLSITLLEYEPGAVVGRPGHRKYRRWSSDTCGIGTPLIRQPTHEARRNTGSCTRCRGAGTNNRSTGCRKYLCDWRSGRTFHPW